MAGGSQDTGTRLSNLCAALPWGSKAFSFDLNDGRRKVQGERCLNTRLTITSSMLRDTSVSNSWRVTMHVCNRES